VVAKYAPDGTPVWAVWDVYAGGKAIVLGSGNTLASLGFGYLVTTHYTQTGLPDLIPAAPTNLSGYADFNGASYRVRLSFADNANNEFWVEVERCTGSGCVNFSRIGQTLGEDSTGFRDETVSGGVVYTYRVRARGFMGASGASNTVEVTIPPSNPPAPPAAPSSLVAAAVSKSQIALTWTNGFAGQDGVKIERCTGANCTNFSQIATLAGTPSNYTDSGLSANTAYRYRVRAYNSAGDSPYSNIASAKTLKK
jgi:hypothetical protein